MPKFRMKYRAPVEGVKIQVSEQTYQALKMAAYESRCTIGKWVESNLRNCARQGMNWAMPAYRASSPTLGKVLTFQISEQFFTEIEMFVKDKNRSAKNWIAAHTLHCLRIEMERQRGVTAEPDRFG